MMSLVFLHNWNRMEIAGSNTGQLPYMYISDQILSDTHYQTVGAWHEVYVLSINSDIHGTIAALQFRYVHYIDWIHFLQIYQYYYYYYWRVSETLYNGVKFRIGDMYLYMRGLVLFWLTKTKAKINFSYT